MSQIVLEPGYYWVRFKDAQPEIAELSEDGLVKKKLIWTFCGSTIEWSSTSPHIRVIKRINELE